MREDAHYIEPSPALQALYIAPAHHVSPRPLAAAFGGTDLDMIAAADRCRLIERLPRAAAR